ncbi:hypothetical protein F5Y16DRAFT_405440 [Xylariaceae sp. FL0255]|nr:hypothetical protein F5Y16DRAFT_405440 [Xylariaceae sp. FL0255]
MYMFVSTVTDENTSLVEDIGTGELRDGVIALQGPLSKATLGQDEGDRRGMMSKPIERVQDPDTGKTLIETPFTDGPVGKRRCHWDVIFDTQEDYAESFFCLPIYRLSRPSHSIFGIAITPVEEGKYKRVGHLSFETVDEHSAKAILEEVPKVEVLLI